jgi:hypothetical protein
MQLARKNELLTRQTYSMDAHFLLDARGRHFTCFGKRPGERQQFRRSKTRGSG